MGDREYTEMVQLNFILDKIHTELERIATELERGNMQ